MCSLACDLPKPSLQTVPPAEELQSADLTRRANFFLEQNDTAQAYPYVCELAALEHSEAPTNIMAGLMALTLGKPNEAREHFLHALKKNTENFDANYNLALLEMAERNWDEAFEILSRLLECNPDHVGLLNDLAVVKMNQENSAGALKLLENALEIDPNSSKARQNAMQLVLENRLYDEGRRLLLLNAKHPQVSDISKADIKEWAQTLKQSSSKIVSRSAAPERLGVEVIPTNQGVKGKRIAFFATQPIFIKDTITLLSKENETQLFTGQSVRQMIELMEWADIAWFEWCDQLIIEATKHPKVCRIICRLHSYETFTDMPRKVDWRKVDHLIFVNRSVKEIFERQVRIGTPVSIIHNGVDLNKFSIPKDKKYGKKIASVGYINYKKNPALLLYCFKKIHAYDAEYTLHVAGQHQDARIQVYFEHFLKENPLPVHFDGWVEDMPGWYADKDFVISTSLFESFHYSIAEGMACGLLPLIHNWYGANYLYPEEFLFNDPDGCLKLLQHLESCDKPKLAHPNRQFIAQRYDQNDKYREIAHLLAELTKNDSDRPMT
jgi:tetratricopeptide (TPR) repeat protein